MVESSVWRPVRQVEHLIAIFNGLFADSENTRLLCGADEPEYRPAEHSADCNRITCRADYFASALHELAHWCLAGARRRQLTDYGYWYRPDGRDPWQQRQFEAVEARPQALERLFSRACDFPFRLSLDNLGGEAVDSEAFALAVRREMQSLCQRMPRRAGLFHDALTVHFGTINARRDARIGADCAQ